MYPLIRPLVFKFPPEAAHNMAIAALKSGLVPAQPKIENKALNQQLFGLEFTNPIGLAPGFDKNAEAIAGLSRQGFGFLELGTVTPEPQDGNPKPRMFRLLRDEAVINRLGFNNNGLVEYCANFRSALPTEQGEAAIAEGSGEYSPAKIILGANIGKNKDTIEAVEDYLVCLEAVAPLADYITINISSPNTAGLRDLQSRHALDELLAALIAKRNSLSKRTPLLLKIAPDLTPQDKEDIAAIALDQQIDGLIISNTTVARPLTLQSRWRGEKGGLSGKPLFAPSTQMLAEIYQLTQGKIPLIGVGGIASAEDAYAKIRAGASLVQLYSALVYQGFGLVTRINQGLVELLARDGFGSISEAVGIENR